MKVKTPDDDEMRPEYDFAKMKFVGRGIYAERYRAGVKFLTYDNDRVREGTNSKGKNGRRKGKAPKAR